MPTNRPLVRDARADRIFRTEKAKFAAIADEVAELNEQGRDLKGPTDVLSFSLLEGDCTEHCGPLLGDVVISLAQAQRQAGKRGVDPWAELLELLVYGVLHLLGYDHLGDRKRAQRMRREQARFTEMLLRLDSK